MPTRIPSRSPSTRSPTSKPTLSPTTSVPTTTLPTPSTGSPSESVSPTTSVPTAALPTQSHSESQALYFNLDCNGSLSSAPSTLKAVQLDIALAANAMPSDIIIIAPSSGSMISAYLPAHASLALFDKFVRGNVTRLGSCVVLGVSTMAHPGTTLAKLSVWLNPSANRPGQLWCSFLRACTPRRWASRLSDERAGFERSLQRSHRGDRDCCATTVLCHCCRCLVPQNEECTSDYDVSVAFGCIRCYLERPSSRGMRSNTARHASRRHQNRSPTRNATVAAYRSP